MDHDAVLAAPDVDRVRIIQEMCEAEGPDALIAWLGKAISDETRRKLYSQAQHALSPHSWGACELDAYAQVARAGIAEYLSQSENLEHSDNALSLKLKDGANVMSFNMAADLADCWPDDGLLREPRHFGEGFAAAENCLRWRTELGKGPFSFHLAYWVKGMHLLSMGDKGGALEAWEQAYDKATAYSEEHKLPLAPDPNADFSVLIDLGYRGIGRLASGDSAGQQDYEDACEAFTAQLGEADVEKRDEAAMGLGQLRKVYQRYVLGYSAEA